jgi:hypothetical protein
MKKMLGYTEDIERNSILDALIFRNDNSAITYKPNKLHKDDQLMKVAVVQSPGCLVYTSPQLQDDTALVRISVKRRGKVLCAASIRLRNDKDTVRLAVASGGNAAFAFASPQLQADAEFVSEIKLYPSFNKKDAATQRMMNCFAPYFASAECEMQDIEGDLMLSNRPSL